MSLPTQVVEREPEEGRELRVAKGALDPGRGRLSSVPSPKDRPNYNDDVDPAVAETVAKLVDTTRVVELERIDVDRLPRRYAYRFVKRAFDIVSCSLALAACAVPMAVIACKIKKDSPGPVFYRQERLGLNGKPITVVKFRSMYIDAEARGAQWAQGDDPRVTPIGKKIRANRMASVIIGTPGDGEPTKSFSHPANSSLDLQLCERRPELASHAEKHYNSCHFLSADLFRGLLGGEKGLAAGAFEKLADAFRAECTRLCWAVAA